MFPKFMWATCPWATKREGSTLALLVAKVFGGQRQSDESCVQYSSFQGSRRMNGSLQKIMAWLREIRLNFVGLLVNADNERTLTMKGGSRMATESWRERFRTVRLLEER